MSHKKKGKDPFGEEPESLSSPLLDPDKVSPELTPAWEENEKSAAAAAERFHRIESDLTALSEKVEALTEKLKGEKGGTHPLSSPTFYVPPEKAPSRIGFGLETLLKVMVKHRASDLHVKPGVRPMVRLDGELIPVGSTALTAADTRKLIFDAMPEGILDRFFQQGYADYACNLPNARFRVNAYRQQAGVSAAIRMLRLDIPTFEELNLPPVMKKFVQHNHGLILVTGPAGNGKSTTLAALINEINATQRKHIITVEDPVEYVHPDKESFITQREVGMDTPSFFDALKQSLRQDPNVILIGEMRDPETIWTAVMAAETGHLVLSTLHTPNTSQAIDRILDPFTGDQQRQFRNLLSRTLRGVISQRLLPRKDGNGRVPAVEIMITTSTIASLIAEGNTSAIYEYIDKGEQEGMQTFTGSLTRLYHAGLITKEVALYYADHPTEFRLGVEGHNTGGVTLDWSASL